MNVSPHLGRVPYGAKELQRVYIKQMSLAFILAVVFTFAILSSLRLIVDPETFNPPPQHVVRIYKYSEIELPRSFSNVEIGMSAYPVLQDQSISSEVVLPNESFPATAFRSKSNSRKQGVPGERRLGEGLSSLPGQIGVDKIQADDRSTYPNDMGNMSASADHNDIAGGAENRVSRGEKVDALCREKPANRQVELIVQELEVLLNHLPERRLMD